MCVIVIKQSAALSKQESHPGHLLSIHPQSWLLLKHIPNDTIKSTIGRNYWLANKCMISCVIWWYNTNMVINYIHILRYLIHHDVSFINNTNQNSVSMWLEPWGGSFWFTLQNECLNPFNGINEPVRAGGRKTPTGQRKSTKT